MKTSNSTQVVGRGFYATIPRPFPQKAVSGLSHSNQAGPPPAGPWPPLTARIALAQTRLLGLVDRFAARGNYAPLQAAHDLLHYWLSTPLPRLAYEADADQLHAVDLLIDSLSEVYPLTDLPTVDGEGLRVEPLNLLEKRTARLTPAFLNRIELSEGEEERAGLIAVPDDAMSPQLRKGAQVVVVAYEREHYGEATGVVLVVMNYAHQRPFTGRLVQSDGVTALLLRDNPQYGEEMLLLSEIHFLASVRYLLNQPVL